MGGEEGGKYRINGYKAGIKVLVGNEKEEMLIWLTNVFNASPEQIIEDYRNRWHRSAEAGYTAQNGSFWSY
ncbi:MAG: hypothetical protein WAV32_02120 [Halobacteriota archaeon]